MNRQEGLQICLQLDRHRPYLGSPFLQQKKLSTGNFSTIFLKHLRSVEGYFV